MQKIDQEIINLEIEKNHIQIKIDNLDWDFDKGIFD